MYLCVCIGVCACMYLYVCLSVYACVSVCLSKTSKTLSGQLAKLIVHVFPPKNMLTAAFVSLNVSEEEVGVYRNAL